MSIEIYKIDLGVDFPEFASGLIEKFKNEFRKIIFITPNKRPIRFIEKNLDTLSALSTEFYTIDEFVKNIFINFSTNFKIHSKIERELFFLELIKKEKNLYEKLGNDNSKVFPWAKRISGLFDEIDKHMLEDNLQNFQYVEMPEAASEILAQLKNLYKSYKKEYENYFYNGKIFRFVSEISGLAEFMKHFKDYIFIFAGLVYISASEINLIKNVSSIARTLFLIQTDLANREKKYIDNEYDIDFETFSVVDNLLEKLKTLNFSKPVEIVKENNTGFPDIKFYQFPDIHSEMFFLSNRIKEFNEKHSVILPDRKALFPFLSQIGKERIPINITMGYPFSDTEFGLFIKSFFIMLIDIERKYRFSGNYIVSTKLFLRVLNKSILLCLKDISNEVSEIKRDIFKQESSNYYFNVHGELFKKLILPFLKIQTFNDLYNSFSLFYSYLNIEKLDRFSKQIISFFYKEIIEPLRKISSKEKFNLYFFHNILMELLKDLEIPFEGHPLKGLQVMGMLEARLLNFNKLFIADVNEGIIPSIDKVDPLLPEDIKKSIGLTSFKEKEELIKYNFFRLIYSAKEVDILYRSGGTSSEKYIRSRFVEQLIFLKELKEKKNVEVVSIPVFLPEVSYEKEYVKNSGIVKEYFKNALINTISPSQINAYLTCPYLHYLKYIKKIGERSNFESDMESNEIGILVHKLFEVNFRKFLGEVVNAKVLKEIKGMMLSDISNLPNSIITHENIHNFIKKLSNFQRKSLQIILNYRTEQFFDYLINKNEEFKVIGIEQKLENEKLHLFGFADRIDEVIRDNEPVIRIVDYKTGYFTAFPKLSKIDTVDIEFSDYGKENLQLLKDIVGSVQMPCYILLGKEHFKKKTEAVIYHFSATNRHDIEKSLTDGYADWFSKILKYILKHMENSEFIYPLPGKQCKYCDYSIFCKYN